MITHPNKMVENAGSIPVGCTVHILARACAWLEWCSPRFERGPYVVLRCQSWVRRGLFTTGIGCCVLQQRAQTARETPTGFVAVTTKPDIQAPIVSKLRTSEQHKAGKTRENIFLVEKFFKLLRSSVVDSHLVCSPGDENKI